MDMKRSAKIMVGIAIIFIITSVALLFRKTMIREEFTVINADSSLEGEEKIN